MRLKRTMGACLVTTQPVLCPMPLIPLLRPRPLTQSQTQRRLKLLVLLRCQPRKRRQRLHQQWLQSQFLRLLFHHQRRHLQELLKSFHEHQMLGLRAICQISVLHL